MVTRIDIDSAIAAAAALRQNPIDSDEGRPTFDEWEEVEGGEVDEAQLRREQDTAPG